MSPVPEVKKGFRARVAARLQAYLFRGLLVVVPLGISLYAVVFLYRFTAARLVPVVRPVVGELHDALIVVIAVALFLSSLFVLGVITRAALGKRVIRLLELVLDRIPVVKTIYGAAKQVVAVMAPAEGQTKYKAAVMAHFPFRGAMSMGFLTGRSTIDGAGDFTRVFIATTPNPTSGYFILYPPGDVFASGIAVEDAVKTALSGGILMPDRMALAPVSTLDGILAEDSGDAEEDETGNAAAPVEKARRRMRRLIRRAGLIIRNRLLSGLLVVVPLVVTVLVIRFIYGLSIGKLTPLAHAAFGAFPAYVVTALSILLFVAAVYMIGVVTTAFFGRKLVQMGEFFIDRLPLVKTIYSGSKQMVEALTFQNAGKTAKVPALVPFPFKGAYSLGFHIGTVRNADGELFHRVYLPTTPNITVGMLELYRAEDVRVCDMTMEDAVKAVVSGGILAPEDFHTRPVSDMPETEGKETE